jgi:hypothetical protein
MNTSIYKRQWDVGSFTDPSKKPYKVSERYNGTWECSCPAWTRHMPRADCKHIAQIKLLQAKVPNNIVMMPTPPPSITRLPAEQQPTIRIENYIIRRRPMDDDLTSAAANPTGPTRSRREL